MNTISNKNILKSLPLLAAILGQRYGVEVRIGGDTAYTDGRIINLPDLPLDSGDDFISLIRGYIDHESAHIRYTNLEVVTAEHFAPFEKFVWNCIEDWRVEQKIAENYGGCGRNLHWLIEHIFHKKGGKQKETLPQEDIANWLLLTVRSWAVPKLSKQILALEQRLPKSVPGLLEVLKPIVQEVQICCKSGQETIAYTRKICDCIKNFSDDADEGHPPNTHPLEDTEKNKMNNSKEVKDTENFGGISQPCHGEAKSNQNSALPDQHNVPDKTESASTQSEMTKDILDNLLGAVEDELPSQLGELAASSLQKQKEKNKGSVIRVAQEYKAAILPLTAVEIQEAKRTTAALKNRLQGLLQTQALTKCYPSRHGRLNTSNIHKLAVQNPRIFLGQGQKQAVDTAVHILLDSSGSMSNRIKTACLACFALTSALQQTQDVDVAVTSFPGCMPSCPDQNPTVAPLIRSGEKKSKPFSVVACGGTPMTEALWYVIPSLVLQPQQRKILFIITDGIPDDPVTARGAIYDAQSFGIEVMGIGISSPAISSILQNNFVNIDAVDRLPQELFGMMQKALLRRM